MNEYKECTLTKEEIIQAVIQTLEIAQNQWHDFETMGKRYKTEIREAELTTKLIQIEALAIQLGIIDTFTV